MSKRSIMTPVHEEMGARMIDFHGFCLPVEYSGIKDEHIAVRTSVGIFDVSHMGEFEVKGTKALEFLQYVCSNDIERLQPGKAQYNYLPNGKGGIVDDLIVYKVSNDHYFLVVNASNAEKDFAWLQKNTFGDVVVENESEKYCQFALQGPNAEKVLSKLTDYDLTTLQSFEFVYKAVSDVLQVMISRTGYTGAGGFELYFMQDYAHQLWRAILKAGEEFGIKPVGLGARDTLRLEMGYCLYGNEIDDTTSPIEAGLAWVTKSEKKEKMIDKEFLDKEQSILHHKRKLVGFELIDRGIPRTGYVVVDKNGNEIGTVTSGSISPMTNKGIGIGYVKCECSIPGNEIFIRIRNKAVKAVIKKFPLYK